MDTKLTDTRYSTVTASGIIRDYWLHDISPDEEYQVKQGILQIWHWNNQFAVRLMMGDIEMTSPFVYLNTLSPQVIADLVYENNGGDIVVAQLNPTLAASILGRMTSKLKATASRNNGKKGGRPRKNTIN